MWDDVSIRSLLTVLCKWWRKDWIDLVPSSIRAPVFMMKKFAHSFLLSWPLKRFSAMFCYPVFLMYTGWSPLHIKNTLNTLNKYIKNTLTLPWFFWRRITSILPVITAPMFSRTPSSLGWTVQQPIAISLSWICPHSHLFPVRGLHSSTYKPPLLPVALNLKPKLLECHSSLVISVISSWTRSFHCWSAWKMVF